MYSMWTRTGFFSIPLRSAIRCTSIIPPPRRPLSAPRFEGSPTGRRSFDAPLLALSAQSSSLASYPHFSHLRFPQKFIKSVQTTALVTTPSFQVPLPTSGEKEKATHPSQKAPSYSNPSPAGSSSADSRSARNTHSATNTPPTGPPRNSSR